METVRTVKALRDRVRAWRAGGERVGLTPTMGALHEGHLSLVHLARRKADKVVATIFVNPTQFGPSEDLATYPRDEARDAAMLAEAGCDLLFVPAVDEMYPPGFATEVRVTGLTDVLCGASRPGHFDGVAQIVTKLLNQAQADIAIFGEKDWQQLAVIRRLARDLDIPTEILGAPILREDDGLAMSSRNRYLGPAEREIAGHLNLLMREAIAARVAGTMADALEAGLAADLLAAGFRSVDYAEFRDGMTLERASGFPRPHERLFCAATVGGARLIDNMDINAGG
ncbi:MAG: pantoate--beta-alanine ligase [Pseudomonadota bacterium]